jgi:ectoine hydroxylase-related dioxygenase (phytanoyl-CoA dioxygenase family)
VWERRNVAAEDGRLLDLVDLPTLLLPACQILGPGIALTGSHAVVRGRSPLSREEARSRPLGWHRDLGVSSLEMSEPHPRLSVKAALWLTPLTGPWQGAMQVVPGSHRLVGPLPIDRSTGRPHGATEVLAEPGDVFLFEQRLWHAGSPNLTDSPRISIFISYSYRWLRPQDFVAFPGEVLESAGPVRRQLLGGAVTQMGYHLPTPEDVPLRSWLEREGPHDG